MQTYFMPPQAAAYRKPCPMPAAAMPWAMPYFGQLPIQKQDRPLPTIDDFMTWQDVSDNTAEMYRKELKYFFDWLQENNVKNPTRQDVMNYRDYLLQEHEAGTARAYLQTVKKFFRWTASIGAYPDAGAQVKNPQVSTEGKHKSLNAQETKTVLEAMPRETVTDLRDYAIMEIMLFMGLRTVEVSRLQLRDMSIRNGEMTLEILGKGKDDKVEMPVPRGTDAAIKAYLEAREDKLKARTPLFVSHSHNSAGKALSTRSISGIAKKAFQAVGIDDRRITAHSCRKTAGTQAHRAGVELYDIQKTLRHSDPKTTCIYIENTLEEKRGVVETIRASVFTPIMEAAA